MKYLEILYCYMSNETKHFGRLVSQDKTSKLPDGARWITEYIYHQ